MFSLEIAFLLHLCYVFRHSAPEGFSRASCGPSPTNADIRIPNLAFTAQPQCPLIQHVNSNHHNRGDPQMECVEVRPVSETSRISTLNTVSFSCFEPYLIFHG
ncbi:hypothetical protein F4823DRAFT_265825 [Ustulina deusta]|nr:hypothetical protein F4823DRAFT_265825 [Ustulina deusta]